VVVCTLIILNMVQDNARRREKQRQQQR